MAAADVIAQNPRLRAEKLTQDAKFTRTALMRKLLSRSPWKAFYVENCSRLVAALGGLQHFARFTFSSLLAVSAFMVAPEHLISSLALGLRQALEGLSVVTVALGVLGSLRLVGRRRPLAAIRLHLGRWLSMALEFQLAADIVATTVNPNGDQLIQLAAVAVIRTFLNVFLAREIAQERGVEAQSPMDESAAELAFPRL
jgi:uncharacterized membrane protein